MSRTRPITPAELKKLVKHLEQPARLAVLIAADTGLRISDILAITPGQLAREMSVVEQKTGKCRKVKLKPSTFKEAKEYSRYSGRYLIDRDRSSIYRQVRRTAAELGMDHVSMHSIRKLYARQYCRAHGLAATQRELRHDFISTTMLYVLNPDDIDSMIGGTEDVHSERG